MSNPLASVLGVLANRSLTLGWDVLVGYSAAAVNDLFAQQYVANVRTQQNLPPINDQLTISGGLVVEFQGVVLGPPLIAFDGNLSGQEAIVTMNFIAGRVVQYIESGSRQYVVGYLDITPGDGFALEMKVQLKDVYVTVDPTKHNVVADLQNADSYAANLLGSGAEAALGQYFQAVFQKETQAALSYELGTIVTGTSENLTPSGFDIRTQPSPEGSGDGAVLLLVATTYNEGGGASPGSDFPYLLPDGYGAFLLVASKTLFQNIIGPQYNDQPGAPGYSVYEMPGTASNPASYLKLSGGQIGAGQVQGQWPGDEHTPNYFWSGDRGDSSNPAVVTFSFDGITVEPQSDHMAITWSSRTSQRFAFKIFSPQFGYAYSSGSVDISISAQVSAQPSVGSTDTVTFEGTGSPTVAFSQSSWAAKWLGNGQAKDEAGAPIAASVKGVVTSIVNFPLSPVDAFPVSSLLFPASHALSYECAYVPGDLALFGQVQPNETTLTIAPLQSVVGPGETVSFSAAGGVQANWSVFPEIGSISPSSGSSTSVYTAPATIPTGAVPVVVTGQSDGAVATAIIVLQSASVAISPSFVLISQGSVSAQDPQTQQFSASVLGGQAVSWSISPADGTAGNVDQAGLYTPPGPPFPLGLTQAIITATTSSGATASAVVLLSTESIIPGVSPQFVSLAQGTTQPFSPPGHMAGTWRVIGNGSITEHGLYTAPASVASAGTDIVVYELRADGSLVSLAVVALSSG